MSTILQKTLTTQQLQPLNPVGYLAQEYARWQNLFAAQPALVQRFLEVQSRSLAEALLLPASEARFRLPDRVVTSPGDPRETPVPAEQREQMVGGLIDRLTRGGLGVALRQRLDELEACAVPSIAASAGLLRFSIATELAGSTLPSGRSVRYAPAEGDEIPTLPVDGDQQPDFAITASTDAIAEEHRHQRAENSSEELLVPYVSAARRFFLPQWVAFDERDRLLVHSLAEAEAHIASMQRYVHTLHTAISLASYIVADAAYQQKRYGMLGQLINQGRALARFETREAIAKIQRRTAANDLNRGLSLSLPYFDDQSLKMKTHDFDVIPTGRIMFIPAFVVLAVSKELAKVEQDTRLNYSTRKHLLAELNMLSAAFDHAGRH
jgi:hypothetical protein